jgi:Na+/H+ antiporter NhaD/arsenite permease-like protein
LTFTAFIVNLAPIAAVIMLVYLPVLVWMYRSSLRTTPEHIRGVMELDENAFITDRRRLVQSLTVLGLTILGFFLHQSLHMESATVALAGAFLLLLLTGEQAMEHALARVEWTTIFFFVGLFVLVAGLVETGVVARLAVRAIDMTGGDTVASSMLFLWLSAFASAFLDNIPFVATMIPLIQEMGQMGVSHLEPLWWSLALGACLGGNGTLIGASANLIAAGLAAKEGHPIRFVKYLKVGFPLMLLSVLLASGYIYVRYLL